jgi:pSer/pThr/pTyr-binding forkhead associated (FHA) protein
MAKLIIYEELPGEETIFEDFELVSKRILIGSSPDNQLVLDSPDIDPAHASLELRFDTWVLQDLGGLGGTAVNGQEIAGPYPLKDNDLIELHHIKIRFSDPVEPTAGVELAMDESEPPPVEQPPLKGRVWFANLAGMTLIIILLILLLLIIAQYFGLLNMADLTPLRSS